MSSEAAPRQIGNYDLLNKIAEGGMGAVYRGRSTLTGQIVAIKIVPAETAKNPVLMKRFEQEFRAASLFDHPNIVKAIEYNGTLATPFLVMEFVDGASLGNIVERRGAMPEDEAIRVMAQVCDGLHRAHKQGLVHRDVKPDNILLTREGVAKLTDMGLVKDVEGELNLTRTGRGLGTPHFMAPEQFRNAKNADVRCDIYSLGATLYMLVTGLVPFAKTSPLDCWMRKTKNEFDPPKKVTPTISERMNRAILRSMSADASRRPTSCREFIEDLTGVPWASASDGESGNSGINLKNLSGIATDDMWYLVYRDASGQQRTVKGSSAKIQDNLIAGTLGDPAPVVVCRTKSGPFVPIRTVPEFRVWAIEPATSLPGGGKTPAAAPATARPGTATTAPVVAPVTVPTGVQSVNAPVPPTEVLTVPPPRTTSRTASRRPTFEKKSPLANLPPWLPWVVIGVVVLLAAVGAAILSRR